MVHIQYYFIFVSGARHSGQTFIFEAQLLGTIARVSQKSRLLPEKKLTRV